ncbi:MAG: glycosyltransferase family 4 protein [Candidatus Micrarchaeota archaeon]|nr:glycosyltransferase family 4 protein [Candidatus Micrarchaeota archaeon]
MKVLLLGMKGEFADNSPSGIVKYMFSLYSEMGKLPGMKVDKVEYKKVAKRLPWANHSAFYLQSLFSDFKGYDLLHNPNCNRIFDKPKNARLVTTVHDLMFLDRTKALNDGGLKSRLVGINSGLADLAATQGLRLALKSDRIITSFPQSREELIKAAPDYDKEKISVVNLGIDDKFIMQKRSPRIPSKHFKIGYLGSFNFSKRIHLAVRAVRMMKEKDVKFEMWGIKNIEAELLDKEIGSDKRIQFMGNEKQSEKVKIFDSFDVFVHPGVYDGLPVLEALARGLPVIVAKDARMTPETRKHCIVAKDEAEIAEKLSWLRSNGYSEKARKEGMLYASRFTWKHTAEQTVNVYRKVFEE